MWDLIQTERLIEHGALCTWRLMFDDQSHWQGVVQMLHHAPPHFLTRYLLDEMPWAQYGPASAQQSRVLMGEVTSQASL